MFRSILSATLANVLLASAAGAATIVVTAGNVPQSDENVLFNLSGLTLTGPTIQGATNSSHLIVDFTSNVSLVGNGGQARVEAGSGTFDNVLIDLPGGGTFTSLIFKINASDDGVAKFTIVDDANVSQVFDNQALAHNGNNFFTIVASPGSMKSVKIESTVNMISLGMDDLRQIRIGGIEDGVAVPLPATAFTGVTLLSLTALGRKRRPLDA